MRARKVLPVSVQVLVAREVVIVADEGFEFVGPFTGRRVAVLNGFSIPLIDAWEADGGTVCVVVDDRLAYSIPAGEAENVLRLVADVIAVAWGYGAHPAGLRLSDLADYERRIAEFARVPHPSLAPKRMIGIGAVQSEQVVAEDDPRDAAA
jgi:hypothetical protein